MNQLKDSFVLEEEKKDKKGDFIYKTLPKQQPKEIKPVPGLTESMLDPSYQILGIGATSGTGHEIVSSATVPYDVVVDGVGFKPKSVIINANPAISGHSVFSNGSASEGNPGNCVYAHDNSNTIFSGTTYSTNKVISLEWYNGTNYSDIEAELKSMNSDGFTLTVTRNDNSNNFNFNYTCF